MSTFKVAPRSIACTLLVWTGSCAAISIGGFDPVKAVTKVITAPAATVINTAKVIVNGGNASTILDPARDAAKSLAPLPPLAANVSTWPQQQLYKQASSLAAKAGKPGEFVFDVATVTQRYEDDLTRSVGAAAANALVGKNPLEVVAIPLAAAIREARARHIGNAKPLPADVRQALANFFTPSVLDRARYTVGTVEITLPNGIGKVRRLFDEDYAVVVDDVIVFPKDPGTFADAPAWWGHEVTHIQQYGSWGIDEFAWRYVKSLGSEVENPAIHRGEEVISWARQNLHGGAAQILAGSSVMPHLGREVDDAPFLPASYVKAQEDAAAARAQQDPPIIRCFFPGDPLEYYGTKSGRIIVVDPSTGRWMQIGWAMPPDIAGPAWVYFIPGRGSYDVFGNGNIFQRFTPGAYGPMGPPGPPRQVGYVARVQ